MRAGLHSSRLAAGLFAATLLLGADFDWDLPPGFPRPVVPPDNPMSAAKVELGRYLFYDKRMSVNGKSSCGTCHRQDLAFTDGKPRAVGTTGETHPRRSMSLINVAYAPYLTWANGTLTSLEEQALVPMLGTTPVELGLLGHENEFLARVAADPLYRRLFPQAFPGEHDPYTLRNVTRAIAAFERSIVSMRSPYDRYRWYGDTRALSEEAKRGEIVFSSGELGRCFRCHGGWNFAPVRFAQAAPRERAESTGGDFFNTGATVYPPPNRGLFEHTGRDADIGKFRVPSLRNIAVIKPYMHDGSIPTLEAVVDHYVAGGKYPHPNQSAIIRPLTLSARDKQDLIAFLQSLTDQEALTDPRWSDPWWGRL